MNTKSLLIVIASTASFWLPGHALAHAMLESSAPANHAVLSTAPKTVTLAFGHPTKLTKLKLLGDGKEIPVTIDPAAPSAKTFSIPLPALKPAAYQVKWSTLADDGHAMTGSLDFTVSGN